MRTLFARLSCWAGAHAWRTLRQLGGGGGPFAEERCGRCGRHVLRYGTERYEWTRSYTQWFDDYRELVS